MSKNVTPASRAALTTSVVWPWSRRAPKLLHPSPASETVSPDLPSRLDSIVPPVSLQTADEPI